MAQIIRVSYPNNFAGKAFKMAYVEFGDEEAMKAGLEKHAEVRTVAVCSMPLLTFPCSTETERFHPRG